MRYHAARDAGIVRGSPLDEWPFTRLPADTGTIRIPKVFHYGALGGPGRAGSFIVMECLDMGGRESQAALGTQLARMHLAQPKVGGVCAASCAACCAVCV